MIKDIMKKLTTEQWIKMARIVHGDRYDYSKADYKGTREKICIICPIHGEFWQIARSHLEGRGCIKCNNGSKPISCNEFIRKSKEVHGEKYDYSKVEYVNSRTKVCIICKEHGEFWIRPSSHLEGQGCPNCKKNVKLTTKTFIEKAQKVHGNKYGYSKVNYTNNHTDICIICPIHGEFWQNPNAHLQGHGCPKCGIEILKEKQALGKEQFIKRAKEVHGDKYDYSKVEYINADTKVCIICPKHGEFWQRPSSHMRGDSCLFCANEENINENKLYNDLICNIKDEVIKQKKFKWLRYKNPMSLDFFIPSKNIAIEYQGDQHFKGVQWYGGENGFKEQLERDLNKIKLCEEHGIKLLHFTYNDKIKWNEYEVYTNINDLLQKIK